MVDGRESDTSTLISNM